ncbi:hypothetical protein CCAX7_004980 [Capsulimonas corticalis]|uniref:Uncharacterized protein n=1 Tax=Capsulimonas corticalis TaxID=2219043 RepID=A0A402D2P6_9BACT|nr:family 43 glycosylhydrolase [Capsulimonas corticalis]BDI28447.1 hypothetical protein CCAX7_004980 [Capsulimonas corticalis]
MKHHKTLFALTCAAAALAPFAASAQREIILPAARDANAPGGLPGLRQLDIQPGMRDPNICHSPDGFYYLTGTIDPADGHTSMWEANDGVPLWRSKDLIHWTSLGIVWSLERDATWSRKWVSEGGGKPRRAVWAPEIHYFNGTYWIPYSMNYYEIGILKSQTGKPEGPYRDVKTDGPIVSGIDPSLFQDDDGKVYLLHDSFNIARLKPDLSALDEPDRKFTFTDNTYGWGEGIYLVKNHGRYIFINTIDPMHNTDGKLPDTYDNTSAVSTGSIYGPYTPRRRAIPHDGHNNLFQDSRGGWWSTYFGSGPFGPWAIRASVLPVAFTPEGRLTIRRTTPRPVWRYTTTAPKGAWTTASYAAKDWKSGAGAFGDPEVSQFGQFTDVGAIWRTSDIWMRQTFTLRSHILGTPQLYIRHNGPAEIWLNGKIAATLAGATSDYVQVTLPDPHSLQPGANTLAVHCQSGGLGYIDVGIVSDPSVLAATSESEAQSWKYTTQTPATDWSAPKFPAANWLTGDAFFGSGLPGVRTPWTTSDIWMRRTFTLTHAPRDPRLRQFHDDDAEVYIDGVAAATLTGYNTAYETSPIDGAARQRLTPGVHTLAVHCGQKTGGQGIDVGIVDAWTAPRSATRIAGRSKSR